MSGVNSKSLIAGRIEICFDGVWQAVCNYLWDMNDAKVVCRQLGFPAQGMNQCSHFNNINLQL